VQRFGSITGQSSKHGRMQRIFLIFMVAGLVFGCKKSAAPNESALLNATSTVGIYGEWQWKYSNFILATYPAPDSLITLTLKPDASYFIGLNGNLLATGTFKIVEQTGLDTGRLEFINLPQTIIDSTDSQTVIDYGTAHFGRLILFVQQNFTIAHDTLQFAPYPCCAPEFYTSVFKKE
jgi:hypothetical protein